MTDAGFDPDLYVKALRFAAAAHASQRVPGTDLPYLVHVCSVTAEVLAVLPHERPARPDLAVPCALLHDVVEDTGTPLERLREVFGDDVAAGVDALTKRAELPKAERMADSLARIAQAPPEIGMVKLADRITNLAPPPPAWTPEKCRAYRVEAEQILAALGGTSALLAARLRARIEAYRRFES
jgi:(p)ppGpp synthase/HD superfamily hydrolase